MFVGRGRGLVLRCWPWKVDGRWDGTEAPDETGSGTGQQQWMGRDRGSGRDGRWDGTEAVDETGGETNKWERHKKITEQKRQVENGRLKTDGIHKKKNPAILMGKKNT